MSSVVAVAVCPQPPMLLPEVAQGAAPELEELRTACFEAVRRLRAADPRAVVIIGAGSPRRYPPGSHGDFRAYGITGIRVGLGRQDCAGPGALPLPILLGGWLLSQPQTAAAPGRAGRAAPRFGRTVAADTDPVGCVALGREIADADRPIGLLVMGDGSARRGERAPGHYDSRAEGFDNAVATALAAADISALTGLAAGLAEELMVSGRAPWQVLAGAAGGAAWRADLLHADAPYGVGYFVASWSRDEVAI